MEASKDREEIILTDDLYTGVNGLDQEEKYFWYQDAWKVCIESGYEDAYRSKHGEKRDYSWYSHQGNGYRYDHFLVKMTMLPFVKNCDYLHAYREEGLSDHSAMLLELDS